MLFNGTRNFLMGFTLGFGSGFIAREMIPVVGRTIRPAFKASMKTIFYAGERAREGLAQLGETLSDLTEEVRFDLRRSKKPKLETEHAPRSSVSKTSKVRKPKATPAAKHEPSVIRLEERRRGA